MLRFTHNCSRLFDAQSARSVYLWGSSLLVLSLAACGAPDSSVIAPSTMAASTSVTTVSPAATSTIRLPTNTLRTATSAALGMAQPTTSSATPPSPIVTTAHEVQVMPTLIPTDLPTTESHQQSATTGAPPTTALPTPSQHWQRYRSDRAGYSVDYPSVWTANERDDTDGSITTVLAPTGGGAGISIITRFGVPSVDSNDIPNTRCQEVTIGGLSGTSCVDTIALTISTTLVGLGKTFNISAGKGVPRDTYQHMLNSFSPTT
jgi:hypothetical protein